MPRQAAATALLGTAIALGACGGENVGDAGGEPEAASAEQGVGQVRAGSVVPLAQCSDWEAGTEEARRATVAEINATLNEAGADGPTPDLPEQEAYDLFERACANEYAAGFRLYKLYARAAAFSRLSVEGEVP